MTEQIKQAIEQYRNGKSLHKIQFENGVHPNTMKKHLTMQDIAEHEKNKQEPARGWRNFKITPRSKNNFVITGRVI